MICCVGRRAIITTIATITAGIDEPVGTDEAKGIRLDALFSAWPVVLPPPSVRSRLKCAALVGG
jgi:hypothetical protein